jgi:hypothetical protein
MIRAARAMLWAAAIAAAVGLCSLDHAANITFGVDLTLTFIQAKKEGANVEVDEKIPAGVKSTLFKAFGSKYKKYTLIKTDERMAHMSQNQEYDVPGGGEKLTVRVTGYKQLWIDFLVTYKGKPIAFRISHGNHHALDLGPEPDPVIIVITAKKVEIQT